MKTFRIAIAVLSLALVAVPLHWQRTITPLPLPSSDAQSRWQAAALNVSFSAAQVAEFAAVGHVLMPQVTPTAMVEEMLLMELSRVETSVWARLFLGHLADRFEAVEYGVSLSIGSVRDFWAFGPSATIVEALLGGDQLRRNPPLLLADAYYAFAGEGEGLRMHTDARSSYCLVSPETSGVSFWLALDTVTESTGGGIEVCKIRGFDRGSANCTTYSVSRGDAILFSKDTPHRTVKWVGGRGRRRALVGRFVPATSRLHVSETPPALVYTNGFDGHYLCAHGLGVGDALASSECFSKAGPEMVTRGPLKLTSPIWPLVTYMLVGAQLSQAVALYLTLVTEVGVASVLTRMTIPSSSSGAFCAACATASLFTHPFVWLWACVLFPWHPFVVRVLLIEIIVVVVEGVALRILLRSWKGRDGVPVISVISALGVSLAMNSASVAVGFALSAALSLRGGGFSIETSLVSWCLCFFLAYRLL